LCGRIAKKYAFEGFWLEFVMVRTGLMDVYNTTKNSRRKRIKDACMRIIMQEMIQGDFIVYYFGWQPIY